MIPIAIRPIHSTAISEPSFLFNVILFMLPRRLFALSGATARAAACPLYGRQGRRL
jgi:hypothetical protein